jgi:hypothetical protein
MKSSNDRRINTEFSVPGRSMDDDVGHEDRFVSV